MIYHVVSKTDWEQAMQQGFYEPASITSEGFIHLSNKEQVGAVLQRYYQNQQDLLLLHVDESKLLAELKYETAPSVNEQFPHLFGRLNLDAITDVTSIS